MEEAGEKKEKRETIEVDDVKKRVNEKKKKSLSFEGYLSYNDDQINEIPIKYLGSRYEASINQKAEKRCKSSNIIR